MNHGVAGNHRVEFRLMGTKSNRAAIGARVTVRAGKLVQFDEVRGGASYLSQNDLRVHFGLGKAARLDSVEVLWPSGAVEKFSGVAADKIYTLVEGEGIRGAVAMAGAVVSATDECCRTQTTATAKALNTATHSRKWRPRMV